MSLSLLDRLKVRSLVWTRYMNEAAIERWSRKTFRRARPTSGAFPGLQRAQEFYDSPGVPEPLRVPLQIPVEGKLGLSYMLPYYYFTGIMFKLYQKIPIDRSTPWSADDHHNRAFPRNQEGWEDTTSDAAFTRLRVQGPNPFLLKFTGEEGQFEVDYTPFFQEIHDPVVCHFTLEEGELEPAWIRIGDTTTQRGHPGWERAKLVANALDARYCVFTRHLLDAHLFIGEAYAMSAYILPADHPLRLFLDFFTYSTLVVNDFAYKLLITPASYFIQSKFISGEDALQMFSNSLAAFSLNDLIVPDDVAKRGIDQIPGHPYVQDGIEGWEILHDFVTRYIDLQYEDDGALANDQAAQGWYDQLAKLLPNHDVTDHPLDGKARLIDVLTCLLYNNVSHEVCGDFSPFFMSQNPEHKKLVNFENLKNGDFDTPASAADVFLMDQGAFAGRFNNGGNNMLTVDVDSLIQDDGLCEAVKGLQQTLRAHNAKLESRNKEREVPFLRMMPKQWEFSVSF